MCKWVRRKPRIELEPHEVVLPGGPDLDLAPTPIDELVLQKAWGEVGNGEIGGNNAGPIVADYKRRGWNTGEDLGAWCASYLSWCIEESLGGPANAAEYAGVRLSTWSRKRHGARWLWRTFGERYGWSEMAEVGTIACWKRGSEPWQAHVGLVSDTGYGFESNVFRTLEGNKGRYPSRVREFAHELGEAGLYDRFARIAA